MLSAVESWNSTVITEILSASSSSVVLSIIWARRYKMSNNLIPASKFHKLPQLVNTRDVGKHRPANKPPRKDDLWNLSQKLWTFKLIYTLTAKQSDGEGKAGGMRWCLSHQCSRAVPQLHIPDSAQGKNTAPLLSIHPSQYPRLQFLPTFLCFDFWLIFSTNSLG